MRVRKVALPALAAALLVCVSATALQEAPMLAKEVAAGKLPPVDERLPTTPLVVQPIESIGTYGGTWRRIIVAITDMGLSDRLGYEPLVRWDQNGTKVVPGVAERWEVLDGGRTFVFHLREGMRWSDGAPFTSEDIVFAIEDYFANTDLSPVFPPWLALNGERATVIAPDPLAIEFRFKEPHGIFLQLMAFMGNFIILPKHYLRQFHPKYTDMAEIERITRSEGRTHWVQLFLSRILYIENPDLPTIRPFKLMNAPPAPRLVATRNPYYWKVDPEGNQLPYIDEIAYTEVQNPEILNFKAMTGDVDFQERGIDAANFSLFMSNRKKGGYRVLRDINPTPTVIYVNQCSKDLALRPLLQDRRFRIALSVAINRAEIIDVIYSGMAVPTRGVSTPFDPYYLPEFDEKYLEYDPARANALLDEIGMQRGSDGMRRMPNGDPFVQILNVYPSETGTGSDLWQLVADYWREVGLEFVLKTDSAPLSQLQAKNGNSDFWAYAAGAMHWVIDPQWYVPWLPTSYWAPLYGQYRASAGRGGVKPPEEYQRLIDWYTGIVAAGEDEALKTELAHRILRQWADECYTIGIVSQEALTIVSNRFHNVPEHIIHNFRLLSPGYIGIEQFYIADTPAR
ncbi:MAG: ABC transporter substrate-binding protein [Candidatus Hydrogenedentes bacterium]|nr:ABC transporter substrate-binding protein [Candidatus Hydrogenedentota bacterium]